MKPVARYFKKQEFIKMEAPLALLPAGITHSLGDTLVYPKSAKVLLYWLGASGNALHYISDVTI